MKPQTCCYPVMDSALQAQEHYGCSSTLGNEPGVQTWVEDVESMPAFQVGCIPVCSSSSSSSQPWRTKLMFSTPSRKLMIIFL